MQSLPDKLHGAANGNHQNAIRMAERIPGYLASAIEHLKAASSDEHGAHLRGGYLRQGDDLLDTVVRHIESVRRELRVAHCPEPDAS